MKKDLHAVNSAHFYCYYASSRWIDFNFKVKENVLYFGEWIEKKEEKKCSLIFWLVLLKKLFTENGYKDSKTDNHSVSKAPGQTFVFET